MPIALETDRYTNNNLSLVAFSIFEMDSLSQPIEAKAAITKLIVSSQKNNSCSYEFKYSSKTDPYQILKTHNHFTLQFAKIDSLDLPSSDCLIISSKDTNTIEYTDVHSNTSNTTFYTTSSKIFSKGAGLVCFTQEDKNHKAVYQLKK